MNGVNATIDILFEYLSYKIQEIDLNDSKSELENSGQIQTDPFNDKQSFGDDLQDYQVISGISCIISGSTQIKNRLSELESSKNSVILICNSGNRKACQNLQSWLDFYINVFIGTFIIVLATYAALAYVVIIHAQNNVENEKHSRVDDQFDSKKWIRY
ncbi:hypothetical protein RF11_15444 [Thelohanellus kitauei]|uniref:Uncharacterized protein n=1 Tax=Thelohanellus kitauei TaxID=669202 RepID=A0A0C2J5J4_THEKT|nr:hypothetical protein RF11_15444 [Thelohanellus kitauei]